MGTVIPCSAVLFDTDGTLVDSTPLIERAAHAWAGGYGIDAEEFLAGAHGRRTSDRIAEFLPPLEVRAATERLDALEAELLAEGGVVALPGVLDLLNAMNGLPWAIVTSMDTGQLRARTQIAGVPLPEVIVTADDVTHGKPDPEGYLLAARRLGVPPEECAVIEDAPAGIRAGKAAGATVIAVTTSHPSGDLAEADLILPDLASVRATRTGLVLPENN
ncbi:HAD-IA family hydrolase [Actinomadura rudentiformis]|uniref:HAD-IA family hydrolase n=1 Tax=Actinomadura rudentiformis TaxID=359158 RepID=A0A6H9YRV0_9ACTN|nr:HAD-IA family hydrolase [Actinomadura rudentiformis]KAB2343022.1 HAD-IA family hydrolase [Actinomadura rudentiformis]